jgi:hypothetical protein
LFSNRDPDRTWSYQVDPQISIPNFLQLFLKTRSRPSTSRSVHTARWNPHFQQQVLQSFQLRRPCWLRTLLSIWRYHCIDFKFLGQFSQRLLVLYSFKRYLGFECRAELSASLLFDT